MSDKKKKKTGFFKGFWDGTKKAVGDFFSDKKRPEVLTKAIDIYADEVTADQDHEKKLLGLLEGSASAGLPAVDLEDPWGTERIAEIGGFRYLYSTDYIAAKTKDGKDQIIPESFKKHFAWEESLKPGMLGRMLRSITIEAPGWKSTKNTKTKVTTTSQKIFYSFAVDTDSAQSVHVSEGDILMFVGFPTGLDKSYADQIDGISGMYLPISAQQWIINEQIVEFSFVKEEIDTTFLQSSKRGKGVDGDIDC